MNEGYAVAKGYGLAPATTQPGIVGIAPPQDTGHYGAALQEQEKLLYSLSDEIGLLRQRLDLMLRPTMPDTASGSSPQPPQPTVSPLTGVAQTNNVKLLVMIAQVRDMAARFDL